MKRWFLGLLIPLLLLFSGCTFATELLKALDELELADLEWLLSDLASTDLDFSSVEFASDEPLLQVYVIDCGQGDAIFTVFPTGETMLVDGSTQDGADEVLEFLEIFQLSKIDYVVATHPHEDHIGGLDDCINEYTVGCVYMPDIVHNTASFERLLNAIESQNAPIEVPSAGDYMVGNKNSEFSVQFLAPNSSEYEEMNNYSIVLRIAYRDRAVMLTGDAEVLSENEILSQGYALTADVLKLGHHGSSTSSSEEFIKAVNPTYAIASCGKDNDYGHPHREIRAMATKLGWNFFRTDTDGTVAVLTDGSEIVVQTLGK